MRTLLTLTLSGSALSLLLLALRYLVLKKMPSTVYYYAWLLVLLRFVLPLPGLVPAVAGTPASASEPASVSYTVPDADRGDGLLTEPAIISPDAREVLPVAEQAAAESFTEQSSAGRSSMIRWNSPMLWLLLWAVGAVAVFAYTVVSYLRFTRSLRRRFREPEPEVRSIYDSLPGRKPALYSCRALKTPCAVCSTPASLCPTAPVTQSSLPTSCAMS